MNKWFKPDKKTYNGPAYRSASSWKLQPHLELTQMHQIAEGSYKQNNGLESMAPDFVAPMSHRSFQPIKMLSDLKI
jgi:hypothetical protein